ncbi:MAG TPA: class D sortase [Candidatus Polarisedimenticolia bacterium]|nr:class D sortase [Candidatus Polarisedimenticolia bacterium]
MKPPPDNAPNNRLRRMGRALAGRSAWVLIGIGAACLLWCGLVLADAGLFEAMQSARLETILSQGTRVLSELRPGGGFRADAAREEAGRTGLVGRIEIPEAGVSAIIMEGDDAATLRRSVGHLPGTAFPGESGNAALAGHRERHFRGLRRVEPGDEIRIDTPDGEFRYEVVTTDVVPPDRVDVLRQGASASLTLITCHPFDFVGPAPNRYIVTARLVAR